MYVIYGMLGLLYLIINIIITIVWMSDGGYRKKWIPIVTVVLLLFGLPIFIIVFVSLLIAGVVEVINERNK